MSYHMTEREFTLWLVIVAQIVQTLLFMLWYKYVGARHAAAKAREMIADYLASDECMPAVVSLVSRFVNHLFPDPETPEDKLPWAAKRMRVVAGNLAHGIVQHFYHTMVGSAGRATRDANAQIEREIDNQTGGLITAMDTIQNQLPDKLKWLAKLPQFQQGLAKALMPKEASTATQAGTGGGGGGW